VLRRRYANGWRPSRAWTARPLLRASLASGSEGKRRWVDCLGAWVIAAARSKPPLNALDTMLTMVNASNIRVMSAVWSQSAARAVLAAD